MEYSIIPTKTDGTWWYSLYLDIDGLPYTLEFNWNERDSSWTCSIADQDGVIAVSKVIPGIRLFKYTDSRLPTSGIFLDKDGPSAPGLYDLGVNYKLIVVNPLAV